MSINLDRSFVMKMKRCIALVEEIVEGKLLVILNKGIFRTKSVVNTIDLLLKLHEVQQY